MTSHRKSMCLSVRGALRDLGARRGAKSYFKDDNGKPLTRIEAIDALHDQLAKGREVIPMGSECGNPCAHADKGCKGFDCGADGGCPGYEISEEVPE